MESMTEECQLEFSKAASNVPDYAKMQGASSGRSNLQTPPHTISIL